MKKPHDIGSQINGEKKYKIILGKKKANMEKNLEKEIHKIVNVEHYTHGKPPKEFLKINHMNNPQTPLD
jgi:hypothetical protein